MALITLMFCLQRPITRCSCYYAHCLISRNHFPAMVIDMETNLMLMEINTVYIHHLYNKTQTFSNTLHNCGLFKWLILHYIAGYGSLIRCASAWYSDGRGFDPHARQYSSVEIGSWINLPFFPFRWFKKGGCQLLAKECALSTGKLPRRLAQKQCG